MTETSANPSGTGRDPELDTSPDREARRARWLLAAGAIAGLGLASAGILEPAPSSESANGEEAPSIAADVNGTIISQETYLRALSALESDKRDPLTEDDKQHVLDRLIDEELLVQRAVVLGLDRTNPVVRNTLVQAMIEIVVAGVGQREPELAEVEAFYETHRDFFRRSDRYWVRQLRFPFGGTSGVTSDAARATAEEAAARLRDGAKLSVVARALGGASVVPLPDGYLPATKLREYLGPTPALAAMAMKAGEVSEPVSAGAAWHVLQLVDRKDELAQPLSAVEPQVRAEMRRRAGDESLRAYLTALRDEAVVHVSD